MNANAPSRIAAPEQGQQRRGRTPWTRVGPDDRVDQQRQAAGDGERARHVQRRAGLRPGVRQPGGGRGEQRQADRHVDEQHPAPAEQIGEDAAAEDADCGAARSRGGPRAERPAASDGVGERRRDEAQGGGSQDGAADALGRTGGDQHAAALREASEQAEEGEEGEADHEDAAAAEEVGSTPAEHQEPGEGERVGVHDPLQRGGRHVQVDAHLRERDVNDRDVEHDHELRQATDGENGPGGHRERRCGSGEARTGDWTLGTAPRSLSGQLFNVEAIRLRYDRPSRVSNYSTLKDYRVCRGREGRARPGRRASRCLEEAEPGAGCSGQSGHDQAATPDALHRA